MAAKIEQILTEMDVKINGNRPWDIQVHDNRFLSRIFQDQSIGAGESYMEGWWDCAALDELFYRIAKKKMVTRFYNPWKIKYITFKNALFNQQTPHKSEEVAQVHYNLGNSLYERMLGKSMAYTCGYWKNATSLDEAQFAKYDLVCRKLTLKPGETVLEIGCGWGGLAKYIAEHYQCTVVGCDIGKEPIRYAQVLCKGLPVKLYHCDYRSTKLYNPRNIKFDKMVSVGVLEHVGYKNYAMLLDICRHFLKPEGIFLLHSIGGNRSKNYCEPWINRYIFPNGMLPSTKQLGQAFENRFVVEDLHNFGAYYEKTLKAWYDNFNQHWEEFSEQYGEKFRRMMNYYLLSCAGAFRAREMQLWQYVLTPNGIENGYLSVR